MQMNLSRLFLAVTILAFLFTLAVSTAMAGSAGGSSDRTHLSDWAKPGKILIESVDAAAGTVVIQARDQTLHTYLIDAHTRILDGTALITIAQIKAGREVRNYFQVGGRNQAASPQGASPTLSYLELAAEPLH